MAAEASVESQLPTGTAAPVEPNLDIPDASSVPAFGADAPADDASYAPEASSLGVGTVGVGLARPAKNASGGAGGACDAEPDEPLRGLYFVRVPKPDLGEESAVQRLQQEFEMRLTTVKLLTETRRLKRVEKGEARANTRNAQEVLRAARELVKDKEEALDPYRKRDKENRQDKQALRNTRTALDADSEAQLDQKLADLEYSLEHESHELREEKAILTQIKRLKAQRPRVREYEASQSQLKERTTATEEVRASKDVLERELKVLRDERKECERVKEEVRAVEDKIDDALAKIDAELDAAVAEKNEFYNRLKDARNARREKLSDFNQNRDFSRKVRGMVAEGRIEEAQTLCNEYTEKLLARLTNDKHYFKEYMRLWGMQRTRAPNFFSGVSDADLGINTKKSKSKKAMGSILDIPLKPGQTKADAVIARALAEADAELKGSKVSDEPVGSPVAVAAKPGRKDRSGKEGVGSRGKTLVMEEKNRPKDAKVDETFEIPDVIKTKDEKPMDIQQHPSPKTVNPEELQKRKDRRKLQAEKRRQRAIEQNKVREEERKRLKEEAESKLQAKRAAQAKAQALSETDGMDSAPEEKEKVVESRVQQRKQQVPAAPKKVFDSGRRPLPRKKKQGALQVMTDAFNKHQTSIAVGAFLVLMLIMLMLWYLQ